MNKTLLSASATDAVLSPRSALYRRNHRHVQQGREAAVRRGGRRWRGGAGAADIPWQQFFTDQRLQQLIDLALENNRDLRVAVLKARSPSCGNTHNYDGSFSGHLVEGEGVTAALLRRAGVKVFNEQQLAEAAAELDRLEGA